jgi:hypothetical protein
MPDVDAMSAAWVYKWITEGMKVNDSNAASRGESDMSQGNIFRNTP